VIEQLNRHLVASQDQMTTLTDGTKLGEVINTPDRCDVIQRDLNKMKNWADRNLKKFTSQ